MQRHLREVQMHLDAAQQPHMAILDGDLAVLDTLCEWDNLRNPELNLQRCESIDAALDLIDASGPDAHLRIIFCDPEFGRHHTFADVMRVPGKRPSILLVESADLYSETTTKFYDTFATRAHGRSALEGPFIGVFNLGVQQSPADCVVFCHTFARAAYAHVGQFKDWHRAQGQGRASCERYSPGWFEASDVTVYAPASLPREFIEHTHSSQVLGAWADRRLSIHQAFTPPRERRYTEEGERHYLTSIEYVRAEILAEAILGMRDAASEGVLSMPLRNVNPKLEAMRLPMPTL